MCIGKSKSSQPAPAPAAPAPNPNNVADTSNAEQRRAVIASQTPSTPPLSTFSSELGNPTGTTQ
jgi:hypothetical protein